MQLFSLRSNNLHSRALGIDFPIIRAAAQFGLPPGCLFDPLAASRNHSSTCNLLPSTLVPELLPTPALAVATDDMSLGFLQRTLHASA